MFLKAGLTLLALLFAYRLTRLITNYITACKIGLPIVVTPFGWQDPLWIIFGSRFSWVQHLPFGQWYKYSYMHWSLHDRFETYDRLKTKAFTIVGPSKNEVVLADADAVGEILGKYKRWHRPRELYTIFATMGENVDSSDGEDWQRHRKIVSHGFREHNNKLVWESATKQAKQWLKSCEGEAQQRSMRRLEEDMNTISANVLMFAGFGQDCGFVDGGLKDIPEGHGQSFSEVMLFMLRNVFLAWATRGLNLPKLIEPRSLARLKETKKELFQYFDESLERGDGDFVKSFMEANENEKNGGRQYLTRGELYGNMYIIQLAGFDTTSYTMLFTLALLATHPEVQEWVRDGIGEVAAYEDSYPNAVRCRAAMHETLRAYGPAPTIARYASNVETLNIAGQEVVIPARTFVSTNFTGCHYDKEVWGKDATAWKPQRWIEVVDGKEQLKKSPELLAWSVGPRICPGKKFSQVEFTAVMDMVLREYRLEASPGLQDALEDFEWQVTPKVKRSKVDAVGVTFIKR